MHNALIELRKRIEDVLYDYKVYIVQENTSVSIGDKAIILWSADSDVSVVGIGAKVAVDRVIVNVDMYRAIKITGDVESCYEALSNDVEKMLNSLMVSPVLGEYLIAVINRISDRTSRVVGYCVANLSVEMVAYRSRS